MSETIAFEGRHVSHEQEAIKNAGEAVFRSAIKTVGESIVAINAANGWNVTTPDDWGADGNPYKIPAVLALLTSEVSEALEAFRHDDAANFAEECADAFIRLVDMTHGLGIDLGLAVLAKLEKNRRRGYRHGGKRV